LKLAQSFGLSDEAAQLALKDLSKRLDAAAKALKEAPVGPAIARRPDRIIGETMERDIRLNWKEIVDAAK